MKQQVLHIMIYVSALVIPHANHMFSMPIYIGICNLFIFNKFFHSIS